MDEFFIDIIRITIVVILYIIVQSCTPIKQLVKIFKIKFTMDQNNISSQLIIPVGTIVVAIICYLFKNININDKFFYLKIIFLTYILINLFLTLFVLGPDSIYIAASLNLISLGACIFLFFNSIKIDKYLYILPIVWFMAFSLIYFGGIQQ